MRHLLVSRLIGFTGLFISCALFAHSTLSYAADPESKQVALDSSPPPSNAAEIVEQALRSEAEGDLVTRDRLLNQAMDADEDCLLARWHRGWLLTKDGQWQSVEADLADAFSGQADSQGLRDYEARRLSSRDDAAGHWQLALWCIDNKLPEQAKAHLARTLEFFPEHVEARRLLGFRNMGGEWLSEEQQQEVVERSESVREGLAKYGKTLGTLARQLKSRHQHIREAAQAEVLEIKDPLAIAPIEAILGNAGRQGALVAIKGLAGIDDPEATMSLARFAMFHPLPEVKQAATTKIRLRPYDDYVPEMLQLLSSPVIAMAVPILGDDGTLAGFRQSFVQERSQQTDVFVLDTTIDYSAGLRRASRRTRVPQIAPDDLASQLEAAGRATERAQQNSQAVQVNNQRIVARNRAVVSFLADVTEHEFAEPSDVWKWWDERNETEYQSPLKPSNVRYATSRLTTRNYTALAMAAASPQTASAECFVRGTPVVTRKGLKPIEGVMVGDLVLSRDVPTGELSWKPVMRTTIRPPRPVIEISLDTENLTCTGGHLFWVSGKGWCKASQLHAGDVLHGAAQPTVVMNVKERAEQETYNLAIDQTHTYFVGKQMVLSHDVTDRLPTRNKVPGLLPVLVVAPLAP